MKIKKIKSDEVRNEAVRLCIELNPSERNKERALGFHLHYAFNWCDSPQHHRFWSNIDNKITPNTPDLKLPKQES